MPQAYVSLGSNIRPEDNICSCTQHLQTRFSNVISSKVYQSPAQGFDGPAFLNSVTGFETEMAVDALRDYLRELEALHERIRTHNKFDSRTLDVDLLLYDDLIMQPEDNLPHSDILDYAFVLYPLAEIAPDYIHPVLGQSIKQISHRSLLSADGLVPVAPDCLKETA